MLLVHVLAQPRTRLMLLVHVLAQPRTPEQQKPPYITPRLNTTLAALVPW